MKKRNRKRTPAGAAAVFLKSVILTMMFSLMFMAAAAVLTAKCAIPEDALSQAAMASLFAGVFIGTTVSAKISSQKKMLFALLSSMIFLLIRSVACLCTETGELFNSAGGGAAFSIICAGICGGLIGSRPAGKSNN